MIRFLQALLTTIALVSAGLLSALPGPAHAEVMLTFYSREFGSSFPHAFYTLKGQVDATGQTVDTSYGFTAVSVSPAILMGAVKGRVETATVKYIKSSNSHFSVRLNDAEYAKVMTLISKWRNFPGKSYSLNNQNCVHFTMETAAVLGLSVNRKSKFFKKPTSFMKELLALNPRFRK